MVARKNSRPVTGSSSTIRVESSRNALWAIIGLLALGVVAAVVFLALCAN